MRVSVKAAAVLLATGLLVTGCAAGSDDAEESVPPAQSPTDAAATQTPAETSPSGDDGASAAPAPGSLAAGGDVDELRDGVWQVGDAGEVEFALDGDALSLTEVRPADGWEQRVADERPDELEVHFTQGMVDWKFEVEMDATGMEISKELEIAQAESGSYQVGSAAEVTFESDGTTVSLSDVTPNDGWTITKQDESTESIEIDFQSESGGAAEFEVEIGDRGLELEISQKLTGPAPS